jgi:hypothetical protein
VNTFIELFLEFVDSMGEKRGRRVSKIKVEATIPHPTNYFYLYFAVGQPWSQFRAHKNSHVRNCTQDLGFSSAPRQKHI